MCLFQVAVVLVVAIVAAVVVVVVAAAAAACCVAICAVAVLLLLPFCEDVAESMLNSFENDMTIEWFTTEHKDKDSHKCLALTCQYVLLEISKTKADQDYHKLAKPIKVTIDRIESVCKAVVALLFPGYNYMSTTVRDVIAISEYRGSDTLEKTLKMVLLQNEFWKAKFAELTKKAGTSKEWSPKYDLHLMKLNAAASSFGPAAELDDGAFPIALKNTVAAMLDYEQMVENMRAGSLDGLDSAFLKLIPTIAKKILDSSGGDLNIVHIEAFIDNLQQFGSSEVVQDFKLQLDKWQVDEASSLASRRLETFLDEALGVPAGSSNLLDLQALKDFVKNQTSNQGKDAVTTDRVKDKVASLMPMIMEKLREQAGYHDILCGLLAVGFWSLVALAFVVFSTCSALVILDWTRLWLWLWL
jgi:hypothetical protein